MFLVPEIDFIDGLEPLIYDEYDHFRIMFDGMVARLTCNGGMEQYWTINELFVSCGKRGENHFFQ